MITEYSVLNQCPNSSTNTNYNNRILFQEGNS